MRFAVLFSFILSCSSISGSGDTDTTLPNASIKHNSSYVWTKLLDSAAWKKSYNFQMFSIRDTVWTFHSDGNWYSTDGQEWKKSPLSNSLNNLAFLDYVFFSDAIYGLGNFSGNIETYRYTPAIYRTTDLRHWDTLTRSSNLPERFFYHPFVFDNKIWIIGGEDKKRKYSDIWNSADGINWVKQKENLPFGERSGSQVVKLRDSLYLLDNDVWRSSDGLNWQLVTKEIIRGEQVFGYSAQVFDNRIWLLGCNRNGHFSSRVVYSSDGVNWESHEAPWAPRGGIAATVFKNMVIMTGGKYGGTPDHPDFRYDNDVWVLKKKNLKNE